MAKALLTNKAQAEKIVIIGRGLLGQALLKMLADYRPIMLTHAELDITNQAQVLQVLTALAPTVIINAAAYTNVDACETNRTLATQVNGVAPGYLAVAAKQLQARLVHYSTDYIFSGQNSAGYSETATDFAPINVYGEAKLAGEQAVQAVADATWQDYYIIRTAWLFGAGGKNFVDTMIALGEQRPAVKVVNDQHGSPTFVEDLARQTCYIIAQRLAPGIYHCTNSGHCTWFELAREIFALTKQPVQVLPCTSVEFPRPAQRPTYSILLNTKLPPLRSWAEALADYIKQR